MLLYFCVMQFSKLIVNIIPIFVLLVAQTAVMYGQRNLSSVRDSTLIRNSQKLSDTLSVRKITPRKADSLSVRDSLSVKDSLSVRDSLSAADSLGPRPEGAIDRPAFSTARDSVIEDFSNGRKMIYYYGDVNVTYGSMKMKAEYMEYDIDKQTVYASGVTDSLGITKGKPEMTDNGQTYEMDNVYYNFKSRKSKIKNMVTKETDGILVGDNIKMMPDQSINISGGKYTVCDAPHPHYYLKMTKAKIETKPKQKTVFGPAYMVLEDVPLPIFLPYGFVPKTPSRASGILVPTFGEEEARGFFLKDGGVYFVMGDYFDISLTGSFYTLGSWNAKLTTRYKLRYKFSGNINVTYSVDQTGDKGALDFFQSKNFGFQWNHTQDPKANPGTSFTASVNFSSPSNSKYNSQSVTQALENQVSSSISYGKTWNKMSLTVNALHSQNSRDSSYVITFPNITFNVNRFYPFKRKLAVGKEKWYEKFALSYSTSLLNKIAFKASEIKEPDFWDKMKMGMTHRFTIGLPSFTLFKYVTLTPSVNYGMNWYFQSQSKYFNEETNQVETVTGKMFGDFGASHDFGASLSLSTRIYGTFNSKNKKSNLVAVRHVLTPSIGFTYKPELGTKINGYRTFDYVDTSGVAHSLEYNKWSGGINSPPGKGQTAALSFSFMNNIEAKLLDKKDTTGVGTKKVKLIDQLSLSGSYNFLADSMRLSVFNVSANTTIFQKVGVSGNMSLDPYAVDDKGKRYNEFNVVKEGKFKLVRLTNASASVSFNISGEGKGKGNDGSGSGVKIGSDASAYTRVYYHPVTGEYIPGGWVYYLNPEAPWSLTVGYSYSYSRSYQYSNQQLQIKNSHTQTLQLTAQVRITKDLNINLNTGVDLTKFKLTTTQLNATYDLHCFQISVSWVPTGQWQSWSFRINAKASALADLLQYKKSSSYWDNRYGQ